MFRDEKMAKNRSDRNINQKAKIRYISEAGMTAALYVVLTLLSAAMGLSSGAVQVRLSEALCVLPVFFPAAIPGVTVGCLAANLLTGGTVYDVVIGTLATLIGAWIAYLLRKMPYLSPIPTVISNAAAIPAVLILSGVGGWDLFPYFALTVGIGEFISCGILGELLIYFIRKNDTLRSFLK